MAELTYARHVLAEIKKRRDSERAAHSLRFFKTGPGEYGEGDQFYGLTVPQIRSIAKNAKNLPLAEVEILIYGTYHEERLIGFIILTNDFIKGDEETQKEIYSFYVKHAKQANNWDLVDTSAHKIVGQWIITHPNDENILYKLSKSTNLWEQRISVIATLTLISHGIFDPTLKLSTHFLRHKHDLIHKACGWALREVGKKDTSKLVLFLDKHTLEMPRTMLRYAIEKLPEKQRKHYLYLR